MIGRRLAGLLLAGMLAGCGGGSGEAEFPENPIKPPPPDAVQGMSTGRGGGGEGPSMPPPPPPPPPGT